MGFAHFGRGEAIGRTHFFYLGWGPERARHIAQKNRAASPLSVCNHWALWNSSKLLVGFRKISCLKVHLFSQDGDTVNTVWVWRRGTSTRGFIFQASLLAGGGSPPPMGKSQDKWLGGKHCHMLVHNFWFGFRRPSNAKSSPTYEERNFITRSVQYVIMQCISS